MYIDKFIFWCMVLTVLVFGFMAGFAYEHHYMVQRTIELLKSC